MTKIKICGLTREEDIAAVNEAKPDYIGFVFAPGRKRTVSALHAARLKSMLSPEIKAVGVFYHNTADEVIAAAELGAIDIIQLHGDEDEAVPYHYAAEAAARYKNCEFVTIPGDNHCYNHHLDQVVAAVKDWAKRQG